MKLRKSHIIVLISLLCCMFLYLSLQFVHSVGNYNDAFAAEGLTMAGASLRGTGTVMLVSPEVVIERQLKELNSTLVTMNRLIMKALNSVESQEEASVVSASNRNINIQPPSTAARINGNSLLTPTLPASVPLTDASPRRTALIFTMDSISTYEMDSQRGGAAGEILVRRSLEGALADLGVAVTVARSDAAFDATDGCAFDYIIMDPWTWAGPGWTPKLNIRNCMGRMYILDFFGTNEVHHALNIPLSRVLTAFGSPWNTFLGFRRDAVSEAEAAAIVTKKRAQGVIWGKDPKHFKGREETLRHIAESVQLISTCQQRQTFSGANRITWRGHQTASSWQALLQESRFLLGLGDPLLGPSAIDAMAAGCMYINPIYEEPVRGIHQTQHDFAEREIGFPHVCSVKLSNITGLMKCIDYAMNNVIRSVVPTKMTKDAYMKRVKQIFEL